MFSFLGRPRGAAALVGASAIAIMAVIAPAHAQDEQRAFHIPAQSLSSALIEFSRQSDVMVVADPALVNGRQAPAIEGSFIPQEALNRLLAGSGLSVERRADGGFVLTDSSSPTQLGAAEAPSEEESIVVTGTNIRGGVQIANVISIGSDQIARSGLQTSGDVIRSLPQSFGGGVNIGVGDGAGGSRNFRVASGASSANIRGLGSESTLTLVNGHRLASTDFVAASDVSLIPVAAIDRVEVLTDGASAIYGSDAVAGVVNFILRRRYDGLRVSGTASTTSRGGGGQYLANVLGGASWGTGGFLASYEYVEAERLEGRDRDFVDVSLDELTLLPELQRNSVFLHFNQSLGVDLDFILTGLYNQTALDEVLVYPAFSYHMVADTEASQSGIVAQLNWDVGDTWRISASANYATQDSDQFQSQYFFGMLFNQIMGSSRNETEVYELKADGVLAATLAGEIRLATGAGYRQEAMTTPLLSRGERDVNYLFGEVSGPLLGARTSAGAEVLSFSLAGRFEDYSDFGETATPKLGLSFQPVDALRLYATWSQSFHAPSLSQLYTPGNAILTFVPDPPGTSLLLYVTGGNAGMTPEEAQTINVGFEYEPPFLPGARLNVSYFNIDYEDRIGLPSTGSFFDSLTDPGLSSFLTFTPDPAMQTALLTNTTLVNLSGLPYDPATVDVLADNRYTNLGVERVEGFDLGLSHRLEFDGASLDTALNAAWLDSTRQAFPGAPWQQVSGAVFNPPEFRARAGATYTRGGASLSGFINYMDGFTDPVTSARVDANTTIDLHGAFRFGETSSLRGVMLSLSIINAADEDPPYLNSPSSFTAYGYDTTNASPLGRVVSLQIAKEF